MSRLGRIGRRVYGVAVLCALGAGASQAFAGPVRTAEARICEEETCNADCQRRGYMGGYCEFGRCFCSVPWGD